MHMSRVLVFMADGLEEIEGLTVVDMLRRADIAVDMVSVSDSLTVKGSHNIEIKADKLLSDAGFDDAEMLVLPGGLPGTYNLRDCPELCDQLKSFAAGGKYVAAICAAPSVLAGLGILEGKKATSYPSFEKKIAQGGAQVLETPVVTDGNIITSRGMGTAIEFAGELIAVLKDRNMADEIKESIVYNA